MVFRKFLKWTLGVAMIFLPLGILWSYFQYHELRLPVGPFGTENREKVEKGRVKCTVVTTIGDRAALRLKVAIPYADPAQRDDLKKKTPRIQNDLVVLLNQPDTEAMLQSRDFAMLKRRIAQIINRSVEKPVDKVYLENFYWN